MVKVAVVALFGLVLAGGVPLGPQHFARERSQTKPQRAQDFNECEYGAKVGVLIGPSTQSLVYPQGSVTGGSLLHQCMALRGYSRKDCRRCGDE